MFSNIFLGVDDLEIWINHSQIINWYFGSHSHEVISSQISFSIQNIIKRKYYSIQIGSLQDNSIFIKQKYYDIYWIQGFAQFSLKDSPMVPMLSGQIDRINEVDELKDVLQNIMIYLCLCIANIMNNIEILSVNE